MDQLLGKTFFRSFWLSDGHFLTLSSSGRQREKAHSGVILYKGTNALLEALALGLYLSLTTSGIPSPCGEHNLVHSSPAGRKRTHAFSDPTTANYMTLNKSLYQYEILLAVP